jgi:ribosomal protein L32E
MEGAPERDGKTRSWKRAEEYRRNKLITGSSWRRRRNILNAHRSDLPRAGSIINDAQT